MNKMNKKGFTLIEMLVVIAIIAILVSIIVPVVSNSTTKAAAATNAANLRSVQSSVQIMVIANPGATVAVENGVATVSVGSTVVGKVDAPNAKALTAGEKSLAKTQAMAVSISTDAATKGQVIVNYGADWTIEKLSYVAENGTYPS